ncbi:MAG: glycosyltransferase [candidate division WOR-3 bacterium]
MKRLLLVSYFYPPHSWSIAAMRPYWFSVLLPKLGWDVWVFTSGGPVRDPSFSDEGVNVLRTGKAEIRSSAPPGVSTLGKTIARLFLWPDSRRFWLREAGRLEGLVREFEPHIILACAPPYTDLLMAERVSERTGIPFAVDLWDPWKEDVYGMYPTPFHKRLTRRAEERVFRKAKMVFVVNGAMREALSSRYPDKRFLTLPFGYDPAGVPGPAPKSNRFHIAYLGSMFGEHKRPEGLFAGFLSLPDNASVEFSFVGNKSQKAKVLIRELGKRFPVRESDYLPHCEAMKVAASAHALVVLSTRGPHYHLISTGKAFEAIGMGRAILGVVPKDTWIWDFLKEHNAYLADPDEQGAIRETTIRMINDWSGGRLMLPDPERIKAFRWEELARKLSDWLSESLEHSNSRARRFY